MPTFITLLHFLQAKLIEFNPLRSTDVQLPDDVAFVISNCCVEANKAATSHFNTRVVECRLASQVNKKSFYSNDDDNGKEILVSFM